MPRVEPAEITFVSLLRARATAQPDRVGYVHLVDGEAEEVPLSYAEADRNARAIAVLLSRSLAPGERALLLYPPGLDFLSALLGCLYAGVIAVPAYPPDPTRLERTLPRLRAIAEDADIAAVLTLSSIESLLGQSFNHTSEALPGRWLCTDGVAPELAEEWREPAIDPGSTAVLQYTSGSTSLPKGVMLGHGSLIAHFAQIQRTVRLSEESVAVSWLPPYHDMGLIGSLLLPIFVGFRVALFSPIAFLQKPVRWLRAISRHHANFSGGPNFAYDLAARKVSAEDLASLDLSSWNFAASSAEPINAATVERFSETFAPCGFRREAFAPCYGLAEATLMVTAKRWGVPPTLRNVDRERLEDGSAEPGDESGRVLVGSGFPETGTQIRIVDPESCRTRSEDQVGEIWVAGDGVAQGYWGRPEESERCFGAFIAESSEGPFLRTGDLGFQHDGELFVTGRIKDLMIVRGRNLHPEDVEAEIASCHPALRPGCGAAFSVLEGEQEQLVVVHEVDPRVTSDFDPVVSAIRRAVALSHQVALHAVTLIEPRSIPKTSSGKIQRHACRQGFLDGTLSALWDWRDALGAGEPEAATPPSADSPALAGAAPEARAIEAWLVARLARRLGVDPQAVDVSRTLVDYGLDSAEAVGVAADLEVWLGRAVSPALAWDFPSIAELAGHLASGTRPAAFPAESGARRRIAEEPVAIVGVGCRFPGAEGPAAFWSLIRDGGDAIREVPPERWNADLFYDPKPGTPGRMNTRWGGFLEGVDRFDPVFFGISRREAEWMDPQQRLLLEVTWEALENAGIPVHELAGSRTGVFMGLGSVDYSYLMQKLRLFPFINPYAGTGNAHSVAANRISYLFDLRGPSLAVDTACSSSHVAIHLACQSLWTGESDSALAGGVNVILTPDVSMAFAQARMLASDGRCKTFSADADGYVRSEGAGVVVLKRLSDALRDGDRLLGIVRGTAVNQDGRTPGITAPRKEAQKAVILEALRQAGASPDEIGYVEAHGTGTEIGDPIEVGALAEVFGQRQEPCWVGSVKANIGHTETATGIAGLIKLLLCLEHEQIPAQLHAEPVNPHLNLEHSGLSIPGENRAWPRAAGPRLGSVSSFGFGGTNAHLIVGEAPAQPRVESTRERPLHLLALSARTEGALAELALRYAVALEEAPDTPLADVCFGANTGRSHFSQRLTIPAASREELGDALAAFATGHAPGPCQQGVRDREKPTVAFLFTGQGAQYPGMTRELYDTQPSFRRTLERCAEILDPLLERPLLQILFDEAGSASLLHQTAYTQPALFAVEYALAELWRSWGIEPDFVMGHSVGEYPAACLAGVLDLPDGLRLIAERARLMQAVRSDGAMAAVMADEASVREALAPYADRVALAAVNGPESVVVSGAREALETLLGALEAEGVRTQRLKVSHAFHSPEIEPTLAPFEAFAASFSYGPPGIPLVSNVTGDLLEENPDAAYWRRHARQPVRFAEGMASLAREGCDVFLEVGPQPTLLGMGRACLPGAKAEWIPSLRRGSEAWASMLSALGRLYTRGLDVNWAGFDRDYQRRRPALPTYPFERERYWLEAPAERGEGEAASSFAAELPVPAGARRHPLLGRRLRSALDMSQFEIQLGCATLPYLAHHQVQGSTVVPATVYLNMALAAAQEVFGRDAAELAQVSFQQACFLKENRSHTLQLVVYPPAGGEAAFQVFSLGAADDGAAGAWTEHASGSIRLGAGQAPGSAPEESPLAALRQRCGEERSAEELYAELRERGLQYGESFRAVERVWRRDGEALARVKLPEALVPGAEGYAVHPALLDACFQALAAAVPEREAEASQGSAYLPMGLRSLRSFQAGASQVWSHCVVTHAEAGDEGALEGDVRLLDDDGALVARAEGLRLVRFGRGAAGVVDEDVCDWLYHVRWEPAALSVGQGNGGAAPGGVRLIFADRGGVGEKLASQLAQDGERPQLVFAGDAFERLDPECFAVDPARREDHERVLREAFPSGSSPGDRIVYCWSLDVPVPDEEAPASFAGPELLAGDSLLLLAQALLNGAESGPPGLTLVTAGAQSLSGADAALGVTQALSWGLGRVIALEHPNLACRRIDLGDPDSEEELLALVGELRLESGPDEMALRGSRRYVPRLVASAPPTGADEGAEGGEKLRPLRLPRSESYCLDISRSGQLDNLCYRAAPRSEPPPGAVEIAVAAAGLNFRDVLNAMGLYPGGPIPFGGECAGTVSAVGEGVSELRPGDEVLAVAPASFAAFAVTDAALVVPKPPAMDFEEAATIPITFLTAHYALNHLARLQAGERVLIHAGAGGVGLAAIQLAQGADAEIFATAGSPEKREFLTSVGVKHVLDSRSLAFADEILEITHGRGVDVVLNSLPGEFISRSLAVLAPYGRFLEIGRTDIYQNRQLGLLPFQNNLSYTAIDLEKVCRERPELLRSLFLELMERFENGMLRPLPHRVFEAPDCVAAFRHMARRRNIGKVVISMGTAREDAQPDPGALRPDATYLVTGGCGALGSLLAERLVERGARHLALLGRSAPSEEVAERLASLGESGASVRVFLADVTDPDALAAALDEIRKELPALRGVFHAAGCVDDGLLTQLDVARFRSVLAPKVDGAWNLHALTRHDPLDRFVLFSSVASLLGSPGQGNYAAANAFQDALARYRRARGRPATAINWGPWARAGMAARAGLERILSARGMEPMPAERALDGLEEVLERDLGQALVACIRWPRLLGALGPGRGGELLASLAEEWSDAAESGAAGDGANGAERILALPAEERLCALIELIQGQLATVMGMERSDLPPDEALTNLGMDSLMGLELKERLESSIGVTLGIEHLVEDPSIADIAGTALAELVPDGDATPSGAPATSGSLALPSADPPAQGRRQTRPDL